MAEKEGEESAEKMIRSGCVQKQLGPGGDPTCDSPFTLRCHQPRGNGKSPTAYNDL